MANGVNVPQSSLAVQVDTENIQRQYRTLAERAAAIAVVDQPSFVQAREVQKDIDSFIKGMGFEFDPGILKAKDLLEHLKQQKEKFVAPARIEKERVRMLADDWAAEEKRQAAAEAERLNAVKRAEAARIAADERKLAEATAEADRRERERQAEIDRKAREKELEAQRKAGEINKKELEKRKKLNEEKAELDRKTAAEEADRQKKLAAQQEKEAAANVKEIRVAPSVPKVAGVKDQTYWYAEAVNPVLIIAEFAMTTDLERRAFLQEFIQVDDGAVGRFARVTKNNEKAAALVPGYRFWSKG